MAVAGLSQLGAALALVPAMWIAPGPASASAVLHDPLVIANVLALALVCSAIAYLLYYRLVRDVGPTRTLTLTFLLPVFGMLWGALFLDERITWPMIGGCGLIIGGTLGCTVDCTWDFTQCTGTGPVCPDGVATGFEECDGTDLKNLDCAALGYTGGTLACKADCTFDASACTGAL
jgi:uncharacterized membrane protein